MAKASKTTKKPISAITGQFVTADFAKKNPKITVNLTVPVKTKTKK